MHKQIPGKWVGARQERYPREREEQVRCVLDQSWEAARSETGERNLSSTIKGHIKDS